MQLWVFLKNLIVCNMRSVIWKQKSILTLSSTLEAIKKLYRLRIEKQVKLNQNFRGIFILFFLSLLIYRTFSAVRCHILLVALIQENSFFSFENCQEMYNSNLNMRGKNRQFFFHNVFVRGIYTNHFQQNFKFINHFDF